MSSKAQRERPLRIGLIGASEIAPNALLEPCRSFPKSAVPYAVAARKPKRAAEFARRHGIRVVHDSYAALLSDPNVEAVYISLPNAMHFEWTVRALHAGKHVLVEKPIASNAREAGVVASLASSSGLIVMEAFHYRYHPLMHAVLNIVTSGVIGRVTHARAKAKFMIFSKSDNRFAFDLSGGALMDAGVYAVHALRAVLNAPLPAGYRSITQGVGPVGPPRSLSSRSHRARPPDGFGTAPAAIVVINDGDADTNAAHALPPPSKDVQKETSPKKKEEPPPKAGAAEAPRGGGAGANGSAAVKQTAVVPSSGPALRGADGEERGGGGGLSSLNGGVGIGGAAAPRVIHSGSRARAGNDSDDADGEDGRPTSVSIMSIVSVMPTPPSTVTSPEGTAVAAAATPPAMAAAMPNAAAGTGASASARAAIPLITDPETGKLRRAPKGASPALKSATFSPASAAEAKTFLLSAAALSDAKSAPSSPSAADAVADVKKPASASASASASEPVKGEGYEVTDASAELMSADVDHAMNATIRTPDGKTGRVEVSLRTLLPSISLRVFGEGKGALHATNFLAPHMVYNRLDWTSAEGVQHSMQFPRNITSYSYQLNAFVNAVRARAPPITDAADAVHNMRVVDAIYSAAKLSVRAPNSPGVPLPAYVTAAAAAVAEPKVLPVATTPRASPPRAVIAAERFTDVKQP